MIYAFILTAYILLILSVGGIIAILGRRVLIQLQEVETSSRHKSSFSKISSWVKKRKLILPKKINTFLTKTQEKKSPLKEDYWDKLLK